MNGEYSFKRIFKNDIKTAASFRFFVFFSAFFVILSVILIINIINNGFNYDSIMHAISTKHVYKLCGLIPIVFFNILIFLFILLKRLHYIKSFQNNCTEIPAKIEYFKTDLDKNGNRTGIKTAFSYRYNNKDYNVNYYLSEDKRNVSYLDKYTMKGETVRILVRNDKPEKILIKEILAEHTPEMIKNKGIKINIKNIAALLFIAFIIIFYFLLKHKAK